MSLFSVTRFAVGVICRKTQTCNGFIPPPPTVVVLVLVLRCSCSSLIALSIYYTLLVESIFAFLSISRLHP